MAATCALSRLPRTCGPVEPPVGADHAFELDLALVLHRAAGIAIDGIDPEQLPRRRGEPPFEAALLVAWRRSGASLLAATAGSEPAARSNGTPYARRYPSGVGRIWSRRPTTGPDSLPKPVRVSVIVAGMRRQRGCAFSAPAAPMVSSTSRGAALVEDRALHLDRGVAGARAAAAGPSSSPRPLPGRPGSAGPAAGRRTGAGSRCPGRRRAPWTSWRTPGGPRRAPGPESATPLVSSWCAGAYAPAARGVKCAASPVTRSGLAVASPDAHPHPRRAARRHHGRRAPAHPRRLRRGRRRDASPRSAPGSRPPSVNADRTIDARGKVVLPGLVNTHHHLPQTLTRNVPRVQEAPLFTLADRALRGLARHDRGRGGRRGAGRPGRAAAHRLHHHHRPPLPVPARARSGSSTSRSPPPATSASASSPRAAP